jgi:uncharacterized damage-inducible protein DinB
MTPDDNLASMFAYTRWADSLMLKAVSQLSPEQFVQEPSPGWASVRSTIVHMGVVMQVWGRSLRGEDPSSARPNEADYQTLQACTTLLHEGHDLFDSLVANLTTEHLNSIWETKDPRGTLRRVPYWAAYRQVINHGTYHRGQVASKLKRLGVDPPFTDLVLWAIEQTPQP